MIDLESVRSRYPRHGRMGVVVVIIPSSASSGAFGECRLKANDGIVSF